MQTELIKQERTAIWQAGYCVVCGDEITGRAEHVCKSRFCFAKWNNWTRIKDRWHELHRECETCGQMFRVNRKPRDVNPHKFCSLQCRRRPRTEPRTRASQAFVDLVGAVRKRRRREAQQRGRRCEVCGEFTYRGPVPRTCAGECEEIRRARYLDEYHRNRYEPSVCVCAECGAKWTPEYGDKRRKFCSEQCLRAHDGARSHRSRCRKYNRAYQPGITRRKVMQRNGWRCGICGGSIDRRLSWPNTRYGTIDHIIPLSVDGSLGHVWRNVQAAHWDCNVDKGAGVADSDQLRLM